MDIVRPKPRKPTVLIIEDCPDTFRLADAVLARNGIQAINAPTVRQAKELLNHKSTDLILLDIYLPDGSGFDICRFMQDDPVLRLLPVIFLTSDEGVDHKVKGLELGAIDYVTKPFVTSELLARVRVGLRLKRMQDILIQNSQIDPLSEVWNRRALMDRLQEIWEECRRHDDVLSLLLLDIDDFQSINENHGRPVGDRVIHQVAQVLLQGCRKYDIPARYGGEEFAVIAPRDTMDKAAILAERCRSMIEKLTIPANTTTIKVTACLGVCDSRSAGNLSELIGRSEQALLAAKKEGNNRIHLAGSPPPA